MTCEDGTEPIADDEILYRRIPQSQGWYDESAKKPPSPEAFRPGRYDTDGISLWRAKYKSIELVAQGQPGKSYYVAEMRAGDLRACGIEIHPTPEKGGIAHVSIPALNYADRKSPRALEWKQLLANRLVQNVKGPFLMPCEEKT